MNHTSAGARSAQRAALSNGYLVRYVLSVLLNIVAEWGLFVGVLVLAFDRGGSTTAGYTAIALLIPYVVCAPIAGSLSERHPAQRVRIAAMMVQSAGLAVSALAAVGDLGVAMIVVPAMISNAGTTVLGPAGAVLRTAIVRSSRELTVANLWVGYADSVSVFLGPLVATAAIAVGGPEAAIVVCAGLSFLALVVALIRQPVDPPGGSERTDRVGALTLMRRELAAVADRPGVLGLMLVAGGQAFLVGAFDILLVIAADEEFGLGPSGAGALITAFGAGAFVSGAATTYLVRRPRLAPTIAAAMAVVGVGSIAIGAISVAIAAFALLPVIGLARSLQDYLGQIMLQRSAPPEALGSIFGVLELMSGLALITGSLATQLVIATLGIRAAFVMVGLYFAVLLALTRRRLLSADASADVPVVAMSLLRRSPVFAPLPRPALEVVARSAVELDVEDGQTIIEQGQRGDEYFVVAQGEFVITVDGSEVDRCKRGDGFGELALLADAPRAATVTAVGPGSLLSVERAPFLIAVTGHDSSRQAAWGVMRRYRGDDATLASPDELAGAGPDDARGEGG